MSIDPRLAVAIARFHADRPAAVGGHFDVDTVDHDALATWAGGSRDGRPSVGSGRTDPEHTDPEHTDPEHADPEHADDIVQVGLAVGVAEGAYDGDVRVRELAGRGDIGIGTLQGLDGEMVVVDGEFFSVGPDGAARAADPDALVPFAVLAHLTVADELTIDAPVDRDAFEDRLRASLPDPDGCYAIRVDGRFGPVRFRSVRRQEPPYRPLADVLAVDQHVFEGEALDATMVGFCFPEDAADLDFPGFHLHMVSTDRRQGGHVFDFTVHQATATIGHCHAVHVELAAVSSAR